MQVFLIRKELQSGLLYNDYMRAVSGGFSMIIALLLIGSILLGGGYFVYSQMRTSDMGERLMIFPTKTPDKAGSGSKTTPEFLGEGCETFEENPNLAIRYEQTSATACGAIQAGDVTNAALVEIRSCIEAAASECKESKSYIHIQELEGSVEYLITTNNCEIFVEQWGTTEDMCGSSFSSCKALSEDYPDVMCGSGGSNILTPIDLPQSDPIEDDEELGGGLGCTSDAECESKTTCLVDESCVSKPMCVNNSCECVVTSCS